MTQNQLKYWELRWKQFYDMRKLELDKYVEDRKLQLDMRKLEETIRHNKHEEKMDRLQYRQNQEKINQEWAKISQNERLAMIKYGIDYVKLHQENIKLDQNQQSIGLKAQELLQKEFLGIADLMLEITKTSDQQSRAWVETYSQSVGEFLKAFGGGAVATGLGEIRGALSTTTYNDLVTNLTKAYPQFASKIKQFDQTATEVFGPQKGPEVSKTVRDDIKDQTDKIKNQFSQELPGTDDKRVIGFSGTLTNDKAMYDQYKKNVEKYGPDVSKYKTGSTPNGVTHFTGGSNASIGKSSNTTPSGTKVIYSPGTGNKIGPGQI